MSWVGNSEEEQRQMLETIGVSRVEELLVDIPRRLEGLLDLPEPLNEGLLLRHMRELAARNRPAGPGCNFIGAGAYEHQIPAIIEPLISRGEFLTAYTPYQPEASQGTLTAIFEFQTMICDLTGLDAANASMYDGASAMAEAALLALRQTRRRRVVVSGAVHPQWLEVLQGYLSGIEDEIVVVGAEGGRCSLEDARLGLDDQTACLIVQSPNFLGQLENLDELAEAAHSVGALLVVAANPLSLGILRPPGEAGADIAVGDVQPFGIPLNFGGPYAGYFAVRQNLVRQMPGRLAGMAWDGEGRRGFTLTLQTREQHIRRERATSNICTNQALLALAATIFLSVTGRRGLQEIARHNLLKAHWAAERLTELPGVSLAFDGPFFNEFPLRLPGSAATVVSEARKRGFWAGYDLGQVDAALENCLLVCVTETKTREDIERFAEALEGILSGSSQEVVLN